MSVQIVDCIIIAMLREERDLFLENNNCLIYNQAMKHKDVLEFEFFDKENKLRRGVLCSSGRNMGNNEASKLFYKISRKYQSELCINIGVAGYINDVNIGDIIIVDDNYSLCEKNADNSSLQKTDAQIDKTFIGEQVRVPIEEFLTDDFKKNSQKKMRILRSELDKYLKAHPQEESVEKSLREVCSHTTNQIGAGTCATYHSVVKDEMTRAAIKKFRKTNIVDMEAYYFNCWHKLIRTEEYVSSLENSKMIFIKSVSDTALEPQKEILEKIGSRKLAMSNIYEVVSAFITSIYCFSTMSDKTLSQYFNEQISNKHIDRLINYNPAADAALDQLCSYLIMNDNINGISFEGKCVETVCDILKQDNKILILEGNPGKGKSTFISYVYKKYATEKAAIFISIPELINGEKQFSSKQILFWLECLLKSNEKITVFVDGIEGSRKKTPRENGEVLDELVELLKKYEGHNVSLCIGTWCASDVNHIKRNVLSKIGETSDDYTLTFKSVSALDESIDQFICRFASFYEYTDAQFRKDEYVEKVQRIIKSEKIQLRYVDFRLLYIFAKKRQSLRDSDNIFEFIEEYCHSKTQNQMDSAIDDVGFVLTGERLVDKYGLLTKNIYSRAFLFARFVYYAFVQNDNQKINIILNNKYILSDNINLFLAYMLNNHYDDANQFVNHVMEKLKQKPNCHFCSKIQLLYNVCAINNLPRRKRQMIKEYLLEEIATIDSDDLAEQERDIIIGYRTMAILLNNRFGEGKYLRKINALLSDINGEDGSGIIRKINRNFHVLYYSQTEFTYDKVLDDVSFELEVIWNTYHILRKSIRDENANAIYIETCAITLLQLIQYVRNQRKLVMVFQNEELEQSIDMLKKKVEEYEMVCAKKVLDEMESSD